MLCSPVWAVRALFSEPGRGWRVSPEGGPGAGRSLGSLSFLLRILWFCRGLPVRVVLDSSDRPSTAASAYVCVPGPLRFLSPAGSLSPLLDSRRASAICFIHWMRKEGHSRASEASSEKLEAPASASWKLASDGPGTLSKNSCYPLGVTWRGLGLPGRRGAHRGPTLLCARQGPGLWMEQLDS